MKAKVDSKTSPYKKSPKKFFKKPLGNDRSGPPEVKLPPLAFMIFDLTDLSRDALVIKITQLTVFEDGETELEHHFFNNGDRPISDEAFAYHQISAEDLQDKPKLSAFNFNVAKNIVVWDGQVTRRILAKNGVAKYPPLINLHSLARYLEVIPKPIRLYDYALKVNPSQRHQIEFKLRKVQNKIQVMPSILKHIEAEYQARYDENSPSFLVTVGRSRTKKLALESIRNYFKKRKEMFKGNTARNSPKNTTTANNEKYGKQVIVISTTLSNENKMMQAVVLKKRIK